jgi:hypothetical protein
MTWVEYNAARQLLAEEFLGRRVRAKVRAEDRQVEATKAAIRRAGGAAPPPVMTNAIAGEPARRGVTNGAR